MLMVEHPVVGDPVLRSSHSLVVSSASELDDLSPRSLEKSELFRFPETPDKMVVSVFRRIQHIFVHRPRRVAVSAAGEGLKEYFLVIDLTERLIEDHFGMISNIPAASCSNTECLVLLGKIKYFLFCSFSYFIHCSALNINWRLLTTANPIN